MHYIIEIARFVLLLGMFIFVVVFGLKACSFLDGLAKKSGIECHPEGVDFEYLLRKPNRKKKEYSICRKIKERRGKFERREWRE